MHRGLCYVESEFKNIFFYTLQLVTPSVVAMAVRKEIAICKIVFQVFAFIIFIIIFNVKCYMLILTWRGGYASFLLAALRRGLYSSPSPPCSVPPPVVPEPPWLVSEPPPCSVPPPVVPPPVVPSPSVPILPPYS